MYPIGWFTAPCLRMEVQGCIGDYLNSIIYHQEPLVTLQGTYMYVLIKCRLSLPEMRHTSNTNINIHQSSKVGFMRHVHVFEHWRTFYSQIIYLKSHFFSQDIFFKCIFNFLYYSLMCMSYCLSFTLTSIAYWPNVRNKSKLYYNTFRKIKLVFSWTCVWPVILRNPIPVLKLMYQSYLIALKNEK